MKAPILPTGRESLADHLLRLSEDLDRIRGLARRYTSHLLVREEIPRKPELAERGRLAIEKAVAAMFDLSVMVRLGNLAVVGLDAAPPVPLLDQVEQGNGRPTAEAPPERPEVVVPPPSKPVRETVIVGQSVAPIAVEAAEPEDGRSRYVAINAFKKVVVFVRAYSIKGARSMVREVKPTLVLTVLEDVEGLGVRSGLEELVAKLVDEDPDCLPEEGGHVEDLEEPEPDEVPTKLPDIDAPGGPEWKPPSDPDDDRLPEWDVTIAGKGDLRWAARVEARDYLDAERIASKLLPEPPLNLKYQAVSSRKRFDGEVKRLGGLRDWMAWEGEKGEKVKAVQLERPILVELLGLPSENGKHPHDPVVGRDPGPVEYDVFQRHKKPQGPVAASWAGRIRSASLAWCEAMFRLVAGEPTNGDTYSFEASDLPGGRSFDGKVLAAGGMRDYSIDGMLAYVVLAPPSVGPAIAAIAAKGDKPDSKPATLFPAKPYDVEVLGIKARDVGEWVCRVECGGYKEAEQIARAILAEPAPGRRFNSVVARSSPPIAAAMARAGGFCEWFDEAGKGYRAVVATNWRELVGVPEDHQAGAAHDRLRLHPEFRPEPVAPIAPASETPADDGDAFDDYFDVIAEGVGPGGKGRLWVARIQAPSVDEAEHFAEELIGTPTGAIRYHAQSVTDEFRISVVRAGGFKSVEPWDSTGRPFPTRAAIARDAEDIIRPRSSAPEPSPAKAQPALSKLDTDDLLLIAAHLRPGMGERWEQLQRDGAGDAEVKATLGRAFGLSEMELEGAKVRGGSHSQPGGCCSFSGGESPKFWSGKTNWSGRPTLESKALVDRARRVLEIPGEDGEAPPAKPSSKGGRKAAIAS